MSWTRQRERERKRERQRERDDCDCIDFTVIIISSRLPALTSKPGRRREPAVTPVVLVSRCG